MRATGIDIAVSMLSRMTCLLPGSVRLSREDEMRAVMRDVLADARARGGFAELLARIAHEALDIMVVSLRLRLTSFVSAATSVPPNTLRIAAPIAAAVLLVATAALGYRTIEQSRFYDEMTVTGADPGGAFSLTLRSGRVVAASLEGVQVPASRVVQEGRTIRILSEHGAPILALQVEAPGTIRWEPRPSRAM
jgi:hypothetical protein